MPKSLDPNTRIVFILESDKDKPKESQPRIFGRTLTVSQSRKLIRALTQLRGSDDMDAQIDASLDALESCLTGWENMIDPATGQPIPFSREALADVLDLGEMTEIMHALGSAGTLTVDEQKKSESPRSSGAANSANRAPRRAKK